MPTIRVALLVSILALAGTVVILGHTEEKAAPSTGIFIEGAGGQTGDKLPSTRFEELKESGIGKSMLTMGLSKPQMHAALNGPKAETRVAGDATFRFQFGPKSSSAQQNMSMQDMMAAMNGGDGSMPPMATTPNDLSLVKLAVNGDRREAQFGSPGANHSKDAVGFSVENLGSEAYRIKPKHPLEPGEYAFYVRMGNAPMGQAWDFGVDQK